MSVPAAHAFGSALRPPAEGECQYCGSRPAVRTTFQSLTSIAIIYIITSFRGWMCRSCGLATYRARTNRTLAAGWWGISAVGVPILLLIDRLRLRKVLRLAPPVPTPGVAAQLPAPMDPGLPVLRRPGAIVAGVVLAGFLLLVALVVWAELTTPSFE
ncbi:hypothetical protein ABZS66_52610 [Dactylosporangium sp. NPDC005572]|uniref:hypothetical protein n=1 Tax=Dactylosporangium sp. NPDC005572 TaxID=3156889 RepID=UPI0033A1FB48